MSVFPNEDFDDAAFDAAFDRAAAQACVKYGFVLSDLPGPMKSERRSALVASRSHTARNLVVDVQNWLSDDDPAVAQAARSGLRRIHNQLYVGDPQEHVGESGDENLADRVISRLMSWRMSRAKSRHPWWAKHRGQVGIRGAALIIALICACAAGLSIATGHLVVALALIAATGALDIFEGAFARVVHLRSPILRWLSCITSQGADLMMIGGIAGAQVIHGNPGGSWAIIAALFISLFGAFVRVSALQAGYRFWVSRPERYVRYLAIVAYCLAALLGYAEAGAYCCAAVVGIHALVGAGNILTKLFRSPHARSVGMIRIGNGSDDVEIGFLNSSNTAAISVYTKVLNPQPDTARSRTLTDW